MGAFASAEVNVSGTEGQAVRVTHDGADHNFRANAEVRDHAAENGNLGSVFLAEEGAVGFTGNQQLGDHGGHTAKMAGSGLAVQTIARAFDLDKCGSTGGGDRKSTRLKSSH